ncbi:hypothetical protein FRC08_013773, partial [Ceratobasidium sp. 394]
MVALDPTRRTHRNGQTEGDDALISSSTRDQKPLPPVPGDTFPLHAPPSRWRFDPSSASTPPNNSPPPINRTNSHNEPARATTLRRRGAIAVREKSRSRDATSAGSPPNTDPAHMEYICILDDDSEPVFVVDHVASSSSSPGRRARHDDVGARRPVRWVIAQSPAEVSQPQAPIADTTLVPRAGPSHRVTSTCSVCLDPTDNFPQDPPTTKCTHRPTVCAPCLEEYITHAIQSGGFTTFPCPDAECKEIMEYFDIRRGASGNAPCLERYEALLLRRLLQNEPNFVWCKNPACSSGQIHECGSTLPMVVCKACHAQSCFTHDIPWHTGLTCTQYDNQRHNIHAQSDFASQQYLDRKTKTCPNRRCGRRVEKIDGCDHMTCHRPGGCGQE